MSAQQGLPAHLSIHRMRHVETIDVPRLFYTVDDMTVWKSMR